MQRLHTSVYPSAKIVKKNETATINRIEVVN